LIIIQNRYQIYNTCTCKNQIQFWGSRVWRIWRHDWSSQLWTQLKQYYCELKPEKKFTPEQDSNTWPLRYWCSAPPTELLSHWELVMLWVCNIPIDDDECKGRYERSYIWTVEKDMIFTCIYYYWSIFFFWSISLLLSKIKTSILKKPCCGSC